MHRKVLVRIVVLLMVSTLGAQTPSTVERELIKLENDWATAWQKKDAAFLQKLWADEYLNTDQDGNTFTKLQDLANVADRGTSMTSFALTDLKVHVYGDMAVVTGLNTVKGTFTLLKPSGHNNYYGLVFGGSDLDNAKQSYTYFLVAQDGTFLVKKRDGDGSTQNVVTLVMHALNAAGRDRLTRQTVNSSGRLRMLHSYSVDPGGARTEASSERSGSGLHWATCSLGTVAHDRDEARRRRDARRLLRAPGRSSAADS